MKRFFSEKSKKVKRSKRVLGIFIVSILCSLLGTGLIAAKSVSDTEKDYVNAMTQFKGLKGGCSTGICSGCSAGCFPDIDHLRQCICTIKAKLIDVEDFIDDVKNDADFTCICNHDLF